MKRYIKSSKTNENMVREKYEKARDIEFNQSRNPEYSDMSIPEKLATQAELLMPFLQYILNTYTSASNVVIKFNAYKDEDIMLQNYPNNKDISYMSKYAWIGIMRDRILYSERFTFDYFLNNHLDDVLAIIDNAIIDDDREGTSTYKDEEGIEESSNSWIDQIENQSFDDAYEGDFLEPIIIDAVNSSGVFVEPSVQNGQGLIVVYDANTDEELYRGDYQDDWVGPILDLAYESSNQQEFESKLKKFLDEFTK